MTGPADDEIEVTLFGRGVGESIVVHLPGGDWIIVDSFEHRGQPVAMQYLDSLGVPAERVKSLVVTHFHLDHYGGIDKLHDRYRNAILMVTDALSLDRFKSLFGDAAAEPLFGNLPGTIERAQNRFVGEDMALRYLHAREPVFWSNRVCVCDVMALSPTSAATHQSHREIAAVISPDREALIEYLKDDNRSAIVLLFEIEDGYGILLAADLVADMPAFGWPAILRGSTKPLQRANLVKVPHHGGKSAHDQRMWDELVTTDAELLVAPYSRSGLPRPPDVARLCALGAQLWQAAPSTTEWVDDEVGNAREKKRVGRVSARRKVGDPRWRVTAEPPAFAACP